MSANKETKSNQTKTIPKYKWNCKFIIFYDNFWLQLYLFCWYYKQEYKHFNMIIITIMILFFVFYMCKEVFKVSFSSSCCTSRFSNLHFNSEFNMLWKWIKLFGERKLCLNSSLPNIYTNIYTELKTKCLDTICS